MDPETTESGTFLSASYGKHPPSRASSAENNGTTPNQDTLTPLSEFHYSVSASFANESMDQTLYSTPEANPWVAKGFLVPLEADVLLHLLLHFPFIVALGMKFARRMIILLVRNGVVAPPLSPSSSSLSFGRRSKGSFGNNHGSSNHGNANAIPPETRVRSQFSVTKCGSWGYVPKMLTSDLVTSLIRSGNADAALLAIRYVTKATVGNNRPPESNMEKWVVATAEGSSPPEVLTLVLSVGNAQQVLSTHPHLLRKLMSDATLANIEVLFTETGSQMNPLVIGSWELGLLSAGLSTRYKNERTALGLPKDQIHASSSVVDILSLIAQCREKGVLRFSCPFAAVLELRAIAAM